MADDIDSADIMVTDTTAAEAIAAAEDRRERLRALMDDLEAALAEPPRRDPAQWYADLIVITGALAAELEDHIVGTEAPGGLFDDVVMRAPRLSTAARRLRDEHPELVAAVAELRRSVEDGTTEPEQVREHGARVLGDLVGHRQRGADLLYEAYWIDVAPGD